MGGVRSSPFEASEVFQTPVFDREPNSRGKQYIPVCKPLYYQRPDPHRGDAKAPLSRPWPTPETPCNNPAPPSRCHDHQGVGNVGRARACRFRAGWGFEYFPGKRVPDEVHRAHSVGWTHWAHLVLCWGHWFVQEENVGKTSKPQSKHYILNEGQTEQEPRVLLSGGGEHDREHRQEGG